MIEVRKAPLMGRGVFATETIRAAQEIARNDADPFTAKEWKNIEQGPFAEYVFMNKKDYARGIMSGFIAWGTISKVNHGNNPSATVETTDENGHLEAILIATRTIHPGEQIFIRYTDAARYAFAA